MSTKEKKKKKQCLLNCMIQQRLEEKNKVEFKHDHEEMGQLR